MFVKEVGGGGALTTIEQSASYPGIRNFSVISYVPHVFTSRERKRERERERNQTTLSHVRSFVFQFSPHCVCNQAKCSIVVGRMHSHKVTFVGEVSHCILLLVYQFSFQKRSREKVYKRLCVFGYV